MAQAEKSGTHPPASTQNGGTNVVNLGPRDSMHGRLEIQGDLKVAGTVEGELKASGDVTVDNTASPLARVGHAPFRGLRSGLVTIEARKPKPPESKPDVETGRRAMSVGPGRRCPRRR